MQITSLSVVTEAASEAGYLYAELAAMGAQMRYIDCGGGLGVDYDGTASESHSSLPFTIQVPPLDAMINLSFCSSAGALCM